MHIRILTLWQFRVLSLFCRVLLTAALLVTINRSVESVWQLLKIL